MSMLDSPTRLADGGATLFNLTTAHRVAWRGETASRAASKAVRGFDLAVDMRMDWEGCPTAVYNEFVASRLGELMGVPVPLGLLAEWNGQLVYASPVTSMVFGRLAHVDDRLARASAEMYPWEAAGLFVFDVLIGNWNRLGGVKASLGALDSRFIVGFNHANSLLMATGPAIFRSVSALRDGCPVLNEHMFTPYLSTSMIEDWLARVGRISTEMFGKRCFVGRQLNCVDITTQDVLACALESRLKDLPELCYEVLSRSAR